MTKDWEIYSYSFLKSRSHSRASRLQCCVDEKINSNIILGGCIGCQVSSWRNPALAPPIFINKF